MSVASGDITEGEALLAEYESMKAEQRSRIGFRDNLLYATFALMLFVAAKADRENTQLLLLLPVMLFVLGWTYLANDEKITAKGRYIRKVIAPRLAKNEERPETAVFGWEAYHCAGPRRVGRKRMQLLVDLTTYCFMPLTALIVYWTVGQFNLWLWSVSVFETAGILALAWNFIAESDLIALRSPH
jgi:hypothetical protein